MGGACMLGDVDGTVEDALPLEQSLRSLTHWWNVQHHPEMMGAEKGFVGEEVGFFERELGKMGAGGGEEQFAGEEERVDETGQAWSGPIEGY